jgi:hypothetical protein
VTSQPCVLPRERIFIQNIEPFWTFRTEPQGVKLRMIVVACGKSVYFQKEVTPYKIISICEKAHKWVVSRMILLSTDVAQN